MQTATPPKKRGAPRKPHALTAQVNVRIDAEVKARADAAFAEAGTSVSEVIRSVYERAVDAPSAQRIVGSLMGDKTDRVAERARRLGNLGRMEHVLDDVCLAYGLPRSKGASTPPLTDEQIERLAFQDFVAEGEL